MALARLSVLKANFLLNVSGSTVDNELKFLLAEATTFAQSYCARTLESATYTDQLCSGDGTKLLWPREWPITTLSTVKIWDGDDSYDTETATYYTLVDSQYIYYPALGQESGATYSNWPKAELNIKLTYTAGYSTTDWATAAITATFGVPADLEYAIAKIAALSLAEGRGDEARLGLESVARSGERQAIESYLTDLPKDVQRTLARYRRKGV